MHNNEEDYYRTCHRTQTPPVFPPKKKRQLYYALRKAHNKQGGSGLRPSVCFTRHTRRPRPIKGEFFQWGYHYYYTPQHQTPGSSYTRHHHIAHSKCTSKVVHQTTSSSTPLRTTVHVVADPTYTPKKTSLLLTIWCNLLTTLPYTGSCSRCFKCVQLIACLLLVLICLSSASSWHHFNNFSQDTPYIFRYSYQMEPYASPTASRRKYSLGRILPAQGEYQPLICLMLHMDERRLGFTSAEKRDSVDHGMVL